MGHIQSNTIKSDLFVPNTESNSEKKAIDQLSFKNIINIKYEKIKLGQNPNVLDLFSGCGGLSLGFQKEQYKILAGLELDTNAARSHGLNFHSANENIDLYLRPHNIEEISPEELLSELGFDGNPEHQVDIIIGGPPCQAFTRIGRAKLRNVAEDEKAFLNDARSQLYKRYLEYVRILKPIAILMENVPDFMNYGGVNIAELVSKDLEELGYSSRYTLLNAANYGVPQTRERMFLMSFHNSLNITAEFPMPTHYIELPKGYEGSRSVALKNIDFSKLDQYHYVIPPSAEANLPHAVSAEDALSDLPIITKHLTGGLKRGTPNLNELIPYSCEAQNDYQKLMRNWPDFKNEDYISANVIRYLPRDYPIFRNMNPGDQYPEAVKVANELFQTALSQKSRKSGNLLSSKSKTYKELFGKIIPPYDVSKFPNKWRKMEADKPSRTLMAHLGKDSYSHIHYDSNQARTISVREAARLQSFPDGFQFSGSMNAAFRQIGNAVPPLLASHLAAKMLDLLLHNRIHVKRKVSILESIQSRDC